METKPAKSDTARIREICEKTGLSEFSLSVYTAMTSKTKPLRISSLFHVVCPNRENIRSLSPAAIREFEAQCASEGGDDTETTTKSGSKKSKKTPDEWRKRMVKARMAELNREGIQVGGTVDMMKKIPPRTLEYQLIWEFLGWGQTSANFYVYVYYIGPEDKGVDFIELTRTENWHIVPETHLVLFLKHMGDVQNFFHQTALSVKESHGNHAHIDYDVRYILSKWSGTKKAKSYLVALVNDNRTLFEQKETMRVKYDCKRSIEADVAVKGEKEEVKSEPVVTKKARKKRVKSEKTVKVEPVVTVPVKEYEVKNDKYRRVTVDEYLDVTRYPLGTNTMTFHVRHLDTLLSNATEDVSRKPASYEWNPTEMIVKPWMIASSMVRLRKQIVQTLMKKYNLCFESSDFDAVHYFIMHNQAAADDIKNHFDQFTWSYSLFNILTMRGFIPDAVDDTLTLQQQQK